MGVAAIQVRLGEAWRQAVEHPFLAGVRDGTVPSAAFDAWLAQDYLFVGDLLWWQARLLARSPRAAQPVLVDGCAALVAELSWFERRAAERGVALATDPAPSTVEYRELLDRLDQAPVPVALAALWAIERVYLDAWRYAAPGAPEFSEFVEHWTTPEFANYVDTLARAADADPAGPDGAVAVGEVVAAEVRFWPAQLGGSA
jgi:thiaminase/transcriptional activator TenA